MWNIDITSLLGCPPGYEEENFYTFNPSMVQIPGCDNLYLLAYRICYYDIAVRLHPWKIWDNGYRYFSDPENVMSRKYRNNMGGAMTCLFDAPFYNNPPPEYDSTGLAIISFNNKFQVKHNMFSPFGQEMNQDARLTVVDGTIYITYNVFEKYCSVSKATMRYRKLAVDFNSKSVSMTPEQYMFTHRYNNFEKNCVFTAKGIIYSIGDTFDYIVNDKIIKKKSPFSKIIKHYGMYNIYSSSSTPVIKYGDKWLGCAHIKAVYKKISKTSPFTNFFMQANKNIRHHGKYVYFAAFYEFDNNMEITRVSNPFIPTYFSDHLPYLLCMPTGLMWFHNKILLSYGEGDCRCKIIICRPEEIEQLLVPEPDCGFYFLTSKFNLQHFGYFGAYNAGDEAFRHVFTYLWDKYYPVANIRFTSPYGTICNEPTIFGGGDVINKHFIDLVPAHAAAVGVGIPYAEFEPLVKKFETIILRNKIDAKNLNLPYAPDLAFLLPNIYKVSVQRVPKLIGISILRTYFNKNFTDPYINYVKEMSKFIKMLINDGFTVVLIPFCINERQPKENDLITCKEITNNVQNSNCKIFKPSLSNQVFEVYLQIAKVEFMICARFHSHIFSTIHATPFISLTCGRKCIEYMQQENLKDYLFKLKTEKWDLPKTINITALSEFFNTKYAERNIIHEKLKHTRKHIFNQIHEFEHNYVNIVKKLVGKGSITMFPQLDPEPMSQLIHINKQNYKPQKATNPQLSAADPKKKSKMEPQNNLPQSTADPKKKSKIERMAPEQPNINLSRTVNVSTAQTQNIQPVLTQTQTQIIQPAYLQTQYVQTQPQPITIQPPQYVQTQPQPISIQPPIQYVQQPQPISIQPQYVQTQPQPQYVQQPQPIQYVQTQPQPISIQPPIQYVQSQPQPQYVQTQPQPITIQPQYVQTQPQPITIQPQYVQSQPPIQYVQTQPQYVQSQPQYVQSQPQYVQPQPQYVQSQPQIIQTTIQPQIAQTIPHMNNYIEINQDAPVISNFV